MKLRLFALFILMSMQTVGADPMLRVRPHLVVQPGEQVVLAQLVDARELSAEIMAKMATIKLTIAPAYGEHQELANASLSSALRPLIQEERARTHKSVHVIIPNSVRLDTVKREIDRDMVQNEILQAWQPLCLDCQLEIEGLSLPRIEGLRDWTLRLKPELPRGSFSLPVDLIRENGSSLSAWVSGRLITRKKVPVAVRALNMGERVTEKDFIWEFRDTSYSIDGIPGSEEIAGRRLRQGLHASDVLWKGMLEREKAIRSGEMVQLRSSEGPWEITMSVLAQQDAYIGDVINLKNPRTGNILTGQVTGLGEAELR